MKWRVGSGRVFAGMMFHSVSGGRYPMQLLQRTSFLGGFRS